MVAPRFFVPDLDPSKPIATLPAEEAAHLGRVLRLRPGAAVHVFDGIGHEWRAEVTDVQADQAAVRLIEPVRAAPELRVPTALVIAMLKGDKMDEVVRDAVMLGVHTIQPIQSSRTQISVETIARSGRVSRWQRVAVSSTKQCGRAVVPRIGEALPFEVWLSREVSSARRLMLVEPSARAEAMPLREIPKPAEVALVVGPEGGWTSDELEMAVSAGVLPVRMGGRTLRADAVPIVALAMCQGLWDDV